jgi:hypothetical protein
MTQYVSKTEDRVIEHTDEAINERIRRDLEARIHFYAKRLDQIQNRLDELEQEWDIERILETQAAGVSLLGLFLGATVSRKWFLLPVVVGGFLLQHAVQGWCPPVPVYRRLGIRTTREINEERYALKALRGDFEQAGSGGNKPMEERISGAIKAAKAAS